MTASDPPSGHRIETRAVTAGRPPAEPDQPLNVPLTLASTYHAGGPVEYGRYGNPTWSAFEHALGDLEGGRAVAFASGMAAIAAALELLDPGAHVVAPRHAYTGTLGQLRDAERRGRLRVTLVDVADTDAVVSAARDAALVWVETPTNPALEVADVAAIAAGAPAGALVVVDNTFATPLLQRPIESGAHLVVHSATKYLGGHSDLLLGAVVAATEELADRLASERMLRGATPGPLETFLALRGMRTLPVRLERAQATAAELVRRLGAHPAVDEVRYPGFGGVVSVVLRDAGAADALSRTTRLWQHATSLGGVESTLERRRRWPAEAPTIPEGLVRLSVGLEHVEDLWADLARALDGLGG